MHQWALNEGIIGESSKIPTMPFPDFIRFKIEYDPDEIDSTSIGDASGESKNTSADEMKQLKDAVNIFRRPPTHSSIL